MIMLPFVVVLVAVGVVAAARHRRAPVMTTAGTPVTADHATPVTPLGRWSLIVLAAGLVLWALTRTTLPIYATAAIGGVSFVLALMARIRSHDRSPLLWLPLLLVPVVAVSGAMFVLLH